MDKMLKIKRNANIEASSLGRMLTRVIEKFPCGARKIIVKFFGIDEPTQDLGYTIPGKDGKAIVYINYGINDSEDGLFSFIAKKEGEDRKDSAFQFVRMGVAAHEDCHQLMTAFDYEQEVLKKYPSRSEQAVRHQFFNILEDPAIEYFSPSYFGGLMQRALRYVIKNTYDWSPELKESDSAYNQYMNSLIQFGDMGCPKGEFTFPEAEDMFLKTATLFNEGVECPDSRKRVDIAMQIADIAEPLWRPEVEKNEEMRRLLEELLDAFEKLGFTGKGTISDEPADPSSPAVKVAMKRKKVAADAKAKAEAKAGEAGDGSDTSEDAKDGSKSDSKDGSESGKAEKSGSGSRLKGDSGEACDGTDAESDEGDDGDADDLDDSELADDDVSEMSEMMSDEESREAKEEREDGASKISEGDFDEFPKDKVRYKGIRTLDFNGREEARKYGYTPEELKGVYDKAIADNAWSVHKLVKELDKIFKSCKEEKKRATSGTYNVKRGAIGTTAKVFDKHREPSDKKDVAVMLLVDQSGSMESKMDTARSAVIIMAEALSKLKVPYYCMGFSADEASRGGGYWAEHGKNDVHIHYVDWSDKPSDRYTLASMEARCNNADGMDIAYASSILEKRPERNKILFVLSDGAPGAKIYDGSLPGIPDTALSVREARNRHQKVFGLLMGSCSAGAHVRIYGADFLHVPNMNVLAASLSKKLVKLIDND